MPAGFEIEQVAGPPLTKRPVAVALDEQGRLFVTEASGTNDPVKKQVVDLPHTLLRLVDSDGDGKFDSGGVFADKLMLPEGVMFFRGSVYVGNPPAVTKFTDTNNDGKADRRETWFDGKTLTGCANDLHGPYAGPDGWIYWTKGAFAHQEYTLSNGKKFSTRASHIFRARPDGTGLEPVMTGGMDNPVDVVFTPGGERIFTTTFLQRPADGKRDGLIHAVYGGIYGKDHDPIYEHPWTGPDLMPVLTHLGAAAPCGLHRYESDQFGRECTDNLFACLFNMHKIVRVALTPDGATFKATDTDFLVSDSLDFHPTDVIEDADGSLLVVDTGGWYKLCCPTSQLHKPDLFGAIYRIKKTGSHKVEDPRGQKIDWNTVATQFDGKWLGDPRPVVRARAVEAFSRGGSLAKGFPTALANLPAAGPVGRTAAVWTACRANGPEARQFIRSALADPDSTVRQAALHAVSLWRDKEAVPELIKLLKSPSMHNRRAAAEALGRIGGEAAVPAILDSLATDPMDRVLEHSLTYALIEIGDRVQIVAGLRPQSPRVRRAAMVALDQRTDGKLGAAAVTEALKHGDEQTRQTAIWIASRHPEWGNAMADWFRGRFADLHATGPDGEKAIWTLARLTQSEPVQQLVADAVSGQKFSSVNPDGRLVALRAMSQSGLKTTPPTWLSAIASLLKEPGANTAEAITTLRALPPVKNPPKDLTEALLKLGDDAKQPEALRLSALAALPGGLPKVDDATFTFLLGRLDKGQPIPERAAATDALAAAKLTPGQYRQIAAALPKSGPLEVGKLIPAFARTRDEAVGRALVHALATPAVRPMIRREQVKPILDKFPASLRPESDKLYAALDADTAAQRTKLEGLLAGLSGGDIRRGQAVFHSPKAACITCHSMGYLGGKVGPDLTRIGGVRSERDLLEAIVFPSASFVRSFEPMKVTTLDGRAFQGILKSDTPDEVVLTLNATEQVRIPRKDIDEIVPGAVSVMPSGLDQQLSKQELADLIAFLKASR